MPQIRPITDLRNTNDISDACHAVKEPIFITKNGYEDLVVMSTDVYNSLNNKSNKDNKDFPQQSNCYSMIKVACATNDVIIANPTQNTKNILKIIDDSKDLDLDILLFPELCISGYSCGDLFYLDSLLQSVLENIEKIRKHTYKNHTLIFVGAPIEFNDKLYNCAIAICDGRILGVVPKSNLPGYGEFYEHRQFSAYNGENTQIIINEKIYPFGTKLIFSNKYQTRLKVACELCEDLWAVITPSTNHALAGANIIVNLSASNELYGKDIDRKNLVKSTSNRLICGYMYASAGNGESTQDIVYSGHNIIAENGNILKESELFENELIVSEIDLDLIMAARRKNTSFKSIDSKDYQIIYFEKKLSIKNELVRQINPFPFITPKDDDSLEFAKRIIKLQTMGLVKRMQHINCKNVVLGLSGGLDSTLALIVCIEAFKYLKLDFKGIHTITMPCFGTSSRTYNNALKLSNILNTTLKNISIKDSVIQHLKDLNHPIEINDITYENAQARERTQILFDYANMINGIVIGTGDLSELALGWCTYNGDHMSNYCVNSSVPKTLVKYLVKAYAFINEDLKEVLFDILQTPISPELLPTKDDIIVQVTEDVVGPYELIDFFIYYLLKYKFETKKIFYYATHAFKGKYSNEEIKKWLNKFISRFFSQQFKRSTLPDGPKVTDISLSSRGDLRMPSDASGNDFKID